MSLCLLQESWKSHQHQHTQKHKKNDINQAPKLFPPLDCFFDFLDKTTAVMKTIISPPSRSVSAMIIRGVFLIGCSLLLPTSQGFSSSLGPKIITHLPLPSRHSSFPLTRRWTSVEDKPATSENEPPNGSSTRTLTPLKRASIPFYKLPRAAYRVYTAYVKRLWKETGVSARKTIANDKVRGSIREMQHILTSNEYGELSDGHCSESRDTLLQACEGMLEALPKVVKEGPKGVASKEVVLVSIEGEDAAAAAAPKKNRSILFGALMGAAVACWVFSGNHVFTSIFCLMTILGQLEYYRMVMNTGVYPARRISVIGATSMFFTVRRRPFGLSSDRLLYRFRDSCAHPTPRSLLLQALFAPELHQICLPMFGLWSMVWFLTKRQQFSTIPEIATTFTGMFYLGYVPSFWVRTRMVGERMEPTRLYGILKPARAYLKSKFGVLIPEGLIHSPITTGSVFIFWSWLSLAFSDVGAYFVGRKYGKTKLGEISPAAGATSPNKSVEGVIGGCVASAAFSILGAWVQKWPYFVVSGAIHGVILGLLGLIGDLTASMLKRDAGLKDFGDLIPEHGGIMDRVDSFIWTAPYSWLVCAYVIPALKAASLR
jgi:phosphatidate cytidylyltransferase